MVRSITSMDYSPVDGEMTRGISGRQEAFHPHIVRVDSGEFTEGPDYDTWRAHGTTDWLLLYTIEGSGRIVSAGGCFETVPGDAVLLRPGVLHDYGTAYAHWTLAFAHFLPRAEWMPLLQWPGVAKGAGRLHTGATVRPRVLSALRKSARSSTAAFMQSELFAVNALETALLWLDTQNSTHGRMDDRIRSVVEHIETHLSDDLSVPTLARIVHVSPSRLSQLFRDGLGVPPQRYVETERLARAAQMLTATSRSVGAIAHDVGWNDALYFSRRFRRLYGKSPTAFRVRVDDL